MADKEGKTIWTKHHIGLSGDPSVVSFIADILFDNGFNEGGHLFEFFNTKYSYHFAKLLQSTFDRGRVCLVDDDIDHELNHFVWVDKQKDIEICYDIRGVYNPRIHSIGRLIDEKFLGDFLNVFINISGKEFYVADQLSRWARKMNMTDEDAVRNIYKVMPKDKFMTRDMTIDEEVYWYWINNEDKLTEIFKDTSIYHKKIQILPDATDDTE